MESKLTPNINRILQMGLHKYYICYWLNNDVSEEYYNNNLNEFTQSKTVLYNAFDSAIKSNVLTLDESKNLIE